MDTRDKSVRDRAQEAERDRQATELALEQFAVVRRPPVSDPPTLAKRLKANRSTSSATFGASLSRVQALSETAHAPGTSEAWPFGVAATARTANASIFPERVTGDGPGTHMESHSKDGD